MLVKDRKSRGLVSMHAGLLVVGCSVKNRSVAIATHAHRASKHRFVTHQAWQGYKTGYKIHPASTLSGNIYNKFNLKRN